jgi:hypothetical protein
MRYMKNVRRILIGKSEGRDQLVDLDIYGRIILKWTLKNKVERINLADDKDQWRAVLNMVMNLRVP